MSKVLILGGKGRIGRSVAQDLVSHTDAEIIITGRTAKNELLQHNLDKSIKLLMLDLDDLEELRKTIKGCDLVVHCAGPFHYRDGRVLKICIEEGVKLILM